ncbi:hypothetical protein MSAN_01538200 [Mycena sanguinolenta]|uniref:Uncharacterized protein n=1 Tax=Mycena sanguinolenta TaxID=230812 RepID=A0A8H7CZB5_9AGAR|nr:hypothetical protein MSAN_01538200 [Mycena sanguinolenta]
MLALDLSYCSYAQSVHGTRTTCGCSKKPSRVAVLRPASTLLKPSLSGAGAPSAAILLCAFCLRVKIATVGKLPVFHQRQPPPPSQRPSSWSPTQSAAPFGQPDFAAGEPLSDGRWNHSFDIEHLFTSNVGYAGASNRAMAANGMSSGVRAMWANAPTNFELEDWGQYFLAMSHWSKTSGTPR